MIQFMVNGQSFTFDGDPTTPLLWVLRDELQMTGTKYGCGLAMCGACTVHVNSAPARACQMPISQINGAQVTTIESMSQDNIGKVVQDAWLKLDVVQCGFCQSGQIMSAVALLQENKKPTDKEIDVAMSGNVCRCGTYVRIREAIHEAAKNLNS